VIEEMVPGQSEQPPPARRLVSALVQATGDFLHVRFERGDQVLASGADFRDRESCGCGTLDGLRAVVLDSPRPVSVGAWASV
jgi:hypothetical protein